MLVRSDFCALHGEMGAKKSNLVTSNVHGLSVPVCFECVCLLIVSLGIPHDAIGRLAVEYRNSTVAHQRKEEKARGDS